MPSAQGRQKVNRPTDWQILKTFFPRISDSEHNLTYVRNLKFNQTTDLSVFLAWIKDCGCKARITDITNRFKCFVLYSSDWDRGTFFHFFFFLRIDGLNLNISVDSYTSIHSPSVNYIIQKGECSLEKRKTKKINKKIKDRSRENLLAVEQMALILRNQCRPISTLQNASTETKEIAKGVKTLPLNSDPLNFTESIKGFR